MTRLNTARGAMMCRVESFQEAIDLPMLPQDAKPNELFSMVFCDNSIRSFNQDGVAYTFVGHDFELFKVPVADSRAGIEFDWSQVTGINPGAV